MFIYLSLILKSIFNSIQNLTNQVVILCDSNFEFFEVLCPSGFWHGVCRCSFVFTYPQVIANNH